MKKIRLGIIGIGNQGTTYAGLIFQGLVPHMELGAICDISREAYEAGCGRHHRQRQNDGRSSRARRKKKLINWLPPSKKNTKLFLTIPITSK